MFLAFSRPSRIWLAIGTYGVEERPVYKRFSIFEVRGYDQSSIAASCSMHDKTEWSCDQESGDINSEAYIIEIALSAAPV